MNNVELNEALNSITYNNSKPEVVVESADSSEEIVPKKPEIVRFSFLLYIWDFITKSANEFTVIYLDYRLIGLKKGRSEIQTKNCFFLIVDLRNRQISEIQTKKSLN
jgi:hypothetical protein